MKFYNLDEIIYRHESITINKIVNFVIDFALKLNLGK
jgi:hypothetical protein